MLHSKVLVCITPQSNSRRLIRRGYEISQEEMGELLILNVERGDSICTKPESSALLQQLFNYAIEFGGSIHALATQEKVSDTIISFIRNEKITHLLLGQTRNDTKEKEHGLIEDITTKLPYVKIEILPKGDLMSIYETWLTQAYDQNGNTVEAFWQPYMVKEQGVYKTLLEAKQSEVTGRISDIANAWDVPVEYVLGFIDGINDALDSPFDEDGLKSIEEDTSVSISFGFDRLYKKMVEYGADHLYSLPEWGNIFDEDQQKKLYTEQRRSRIVIKDKLPGRNDPCTCGSGNKYKKCCGASA